MKEKIIAHEKNEYVRILGIWISADGKKSYQKTLIEEKTRNICRMVERAKITDKGARYIINHMLFPAIEYLLNDVYLNTSICKKINSICLKTFKHKAGFAQTAINSIFHLKEGYNIFNIEDRQLQLHTNNLNDRINRDDLLGESMKIRLQQFQNWLWTDKSMFDKDLKLIVLESTNKGKSIVTIPSGGKYTIKQLRGDVGYEEQLLNKGLRENGIMFIEQIMNLNFKDILNWHHIQTTHPKRGRPPGWKRIQKGKTMLVPCEGCEINTRENNNECVYRLDRDKEDKIEIPVVYSKISASNTLTNLLKTG
ncbi:hypothetical protein Glove_136g51 [Diversispora epigaea]|uniref:Uncharacterized protein n=1 Tax=Diversispora epigaea TaxID=1348612 RepID=A0A397IWL0_9GLOM|nr:hypothetical protein Glove_136g51 [Diversispora epigaea]